MHITIGLSEEEAEELERLLDQKSEPTLIEIHRCDNKRFRKELEHRFDLDRHILDLIRQARHVQQANYSGVAI